MLCQIFELSLFKIVSAVPVIWWWFWGTLRSLAFLHSTKLEVFNCQYLNPCSSRCIKNILAAREIRQCACLKSRKLWYNNSKKAGDEVVDILFKFHNRVQTGVILLWFFKSPAFTESISFFQFYSVVFEHNNHIYKFVFPEDDKRTWYEAESLCQTLEDGHLTSLVSPNEITWVDSIITNIARDSGSKVKLWIGGSDRKIKDVWDFVDEKPLRYNVVPWAPGQPRRPNQQATYAYCVSLEFAGDRSTWYVEDCYKTHGYICKADGQSSLISLYYSAFMLTKLQERWNP